MQVRQISKSGQALYVSIPREYARILKWRHHDYVTIHLERGALIVARLKDDRAATAPPVPGSR